MVMARIAAPSVLVGLNDTVLKSLAPSTRRSWGGGRGVVAACMLALLSMSMVDPTAGEHGLGQCTCVTCISASASSRSTFNLYINGEFRTSKSGKTLPVVAPFNK